MQEFTLLPDSGALVIAETDVKDTLGIQKSIQPLKIGKREVAQWGDQNQGPRELLSLCFENHFKPQLIKTSRDLLCGAGLMIYKRIYENGKKKAVPVDADVANQWLDAFEIEKVYRQLAYNLELYGNAPLCSTLSAASGEHLDIRALSCTDVRAETASITNYRVNNYFLHPSWKGVSAKDLVPVAAFDPRNPTAKRDSILWLRDGIPGNPYYDVPDWYGSRKWTEVSNLIALFHFAGLTNGYNIKYIVRIPENYFDKYGDEKEAKEKEWRQAMDRFLAGVKNNGKPILEKYQMINGQEIPGLKIEVVPNGGGDDSYMKVNEAANQIHASAHRIDPSLAGIDTGSKLGGSGSEKRISYLIHLAINTPVKRSILLDGLTRLARINPWWDPSWRIGVEDIELTTLAENKSGQTDPAINRAAA